MSANPARRYTLEKYFELERTSEERFEFRDGKVFCLPGASQAHSEIYGLWVHTEVNNLESTLTLTSLGRDLPLSEIYAGVSFDNHPDATL
jgi:hypothetical protein